MQKPTKNNGTTIIFRIFLTTFAPAKTTKHHFRSKGEMVEWSITPVLKTGTPRGVGGSNPSLSADNPCKSLIYKDFSFKCLK